jgi:DNA-binding transcriptional LysR family regulator
MPDQFLAAPSALLDTTMDQLRTLIAVHETGSALNAARLLGREQSSVQKQLDTLNRNLGGLCGEPLVVKQGRGKDVLYTDTGAALAELARSTLAGWADAVEAVCRRLGSALSVGSTRYTLGYLLSAVEPLTAEFECRGVEFKLVHVRTRDMFEKLRCKEVDLICGSTATLVGADPELEGLEVMEWRRSGLSVVTSIPTSRLPYHSLPVSRIGALPLVTSANGLIPAFLRGWYGSDYRDKLDIAVEIDAVQYGFELLASGVIDGCMIVTGGIGEAVREGRIPDAKGLRVLQLEDDVGPQREVLVGVFTRGGERDALAAAHPLNLVWHRLREQTEAYRPPDLLEDARSRLASAFRLRWCPDLGRERESAF